MLDGRSEVLLDVQIIQVAHTGERNTGVVPPPSFSAFKRIRRGAGRCSARTRPWCNRSFPPDWHRAITHWPSWAFSSHPARFRVRCSRAALRCSAAALTESALVPGATKFNLSLNTSDSRELDQIELRMEDGQDETLKEGERYPIQTSSYSSLSPNIPNIAGLTGAGASSSLSSLLSSLTSSVPNVPMVQYQDLGLNLKVTPKVLRDGDVALNIDLKLDALSGTLINGNPVLDNRAYNGMVTLRQGEATVVATELDKSQSLAISGTPGISEIPRAERSDRQRFAEELCDARNRDDAPRHPRDASGRSHRNDACGAGHGVAARFDPVRIPLPPIHAQFNLPLKLSAHCQPSFQKGRGLLT